MLHRKLSQYVLAYSLAINSISGLYWVGVVSSSPALSALLKTSMYVGRFFFRMIAGGYFALRSIAFISMRPVLPFPSKKGWIFSNLW